MKAVDAKRCRDLIYSNFLNEDKIYECIKILSNRDDCDTDYKVSLYIARLYMKLREYDLAKLNFLKSFVISGDRILYYNLYYASVSNGEFLNAKDYLNMSDIPDNEKTLNNYLLDLIIDSNNILKYSYDTDSFNLADDDSFYSNVANKKINDALYRKNYESLYLNLCYIKEKFNNNLNIRTLNSLIYLSNIVMGLLPDDKKLALMIEDSIENMQYDDSLYYIDLLSKRNNDKYNKFLKIEKNKIREIYEIDELQSSSILFEKFEKSRILIKNGDYDYAIRILFELKKNKNLIIYDYYLGKAFFKKHKNKSAEGFLKEYLKNGGIKYNKANFYLYLIAYYSRSNKMIKEYFENDCYINNILGKEPFIFPKFYRYDRVDYYDRKSNKILQKINISEDEFKRKI